MPEESTTLVDTEMLKDIRRSVNVLYSDVKTFRDSFGCITEPTPEQRSIALTQIMKRLDMIDYNMTALLPYDRPLQAEELHNATTPTPSPNGGVS